MPVTPGGSWNEARGLACFTHAAFYHDAGSMQAHLLASLPGVAACHVAPVFWTSKLGTMLQGPGAVQVGLSIGTFYRQSLATGSPIPAPTRWRQLAWTFALTPTVAAATGVSITQARQGGGGTLAQTQVGAAKFSAPSLEPLMAWVGPGPTFGSYRFRQTGIVPGTFMGGQEWTT